MNPRCDAVKQLRDGFASALDMDSPGYNRLHSQAVVLSGPALDAWFLEVAEKIQGGATAMSPDQAEIAMLQGILHEFVSIMRPFALAADAQQHTDCGGIIAQADWEKVAAVVHNYDELHKQEQTL